MKAGRTKLKVDNFIRAGKYFTEVVEFESVSKGGN